MARTAERSQLSATEYLAREREQAAKHEFFHGEVFAMAGGSPRHNALGVRVAAALRAATRGRGRAQGPGQRVVLTGGVELNGDAIFAGVFELPGD